MLYNGLTLNYCTVEEPPLKMSLFPAPNTDLLTEEDNPHTSMHVIDKLQLTISCISY